MYLGNGNSILDRTAKYREPLNEEQREIFDAVLVRKESVFIAGSGGTGKSFLIEQIVDAARDMGKRVLVTASTGVAAIKIKGITVASAFDLKAEIAIDAKGRPKRHAPEVVKQADIIVIDEISLLRRDAFEAVYAGIQKANGLRKKDHKPPIRVVIVGDFLQLPPVLVAEERAILDLLYGFPVGRAYCFQSDAWKKFRLEPYELTQIVRQSNIEDRHLLELVRIGSNAWSICDRVYEKSAKVRPKNAPRLYAKNEQVKQINSAELAKLPGESFFSSASILSGALEQSEIDSINNWELELKQGCRIMFTCNGAIADWCEVFPDYISPKDVFANGTIGIVRSIDNPTGDAMDATLIIEVPNFYNDGGSITVSIKPRRHSIFTYNTKNGTLQKETKCEYCQFPVVPAYAITIHKSQGATYDSLIIDPKGIFESAQLYVALSRCTSLANVYLEHEITPDMITVDNEVIKFYKDMRSEIQRRKERKKE